MRKNLAKILCDKYPISYRADSLGIGGKNYELPFYFECSGGWFNLIDQASEQVEKIANLINPEIDRPLVVQVKEKFGGLRFYTENISQKYNAFHELVHVLESESLRICEFCSSPGERRKTGWIKTLCDSCFSKWNSKIRFDKLYEEFEK